MTQKGAARRDSLIEAAVTLLADQGWAGVTHRAVAAHAGANPGLVHYYFEGSAGLRLAVAERAAHHSIGGVVARLLEAPDEEHLLRDVAALLDSNSRDPVGARLTPHLVAAGFTDPAVGAVLANTLAAARAAVVEWLTEHRPDLTSEQAAGRAALLLAAVDGAVLHTVLDPALPTAQLVAALAGLLNPTSAASR